jgi:hypothetical protein
MTFTLSGIRLLPLSVIVVPFPLDTPDQMMYAPTIV